MRKGLIGLVCAVMLASTVVATGCSGSSGSTGGGGSGGGSDGSAGGSSGSGGSGGGSGGVDGGATSITSISGSKTLGSLNATEAAQLCADAAAYFARTITQANRCKYAGLTFAASSSAPTDDALRANCTMAQNACNQPDAAGPTTNTTCLDIPAGCNVTVAQYSACIVDETAAFTQTVSTLAACATLTRPDITPVFDAQSSISQPSSSNCMAITNANSCSGFSAPIAN